MSNDQRKSINKENTGAIRKTVMTGAIRKTVMFNDGVSSDSQETKNTATSSSHLDKPRLNKLAELRKTLNEIKNYEAKIVGNTQDISENSQQIMNRAVSSKLNFPLRESVFKDLPKIDAKITADHLIHHAVRKTKEKNRKSQEVRDEIKDLVSKLVELEYQNEEMNRKAEYCPLPNEEEYLGFNKFKEVNFCLPIKKTETERFHKKVYEQIDKALFAREDYCTYNKQRDITKLARNRSKECNCINSADFYTRHSMCS